MNTVTAYATRAHAALVAARKITAKGAPFTRQDDVRAARLADYAQRCDDLASIADGTRDTAAFRKAGDHADETRAEWHDIRISRRLGVHLS